MCAPRLAKPVPLQTNSGDTSSARKARRTVIKDEHRAKAAQRHEVYQERTNKQNDQLKTIKVMKRRNSYIASTLVLALVLMRVCQNSLILKKSQSPDFHKPGLCYV